MLFVAVKLSWEYRTGNTHNRYELRTNGSLSMITERKKARITIVKINLEPFLNALCAYMYRYMWVPSYAFCITHNQMHYAIEFEFNCTRCTVSCPISNIVSKFEIFNWMLRNWFITNKSAEIGDAVIVMRFGSFQSNNCCWRDLPNIDHTNQDGNSPHLWMEQKTFSSIDPNFEFMKMIRYGN